MKNPKIGDKIYVGTSLSISHGSDDFHGGICTISEIDKSEKLQVNHMNYIFIGIEERPGTDTYDKNLLENGILVCQNDRCGQTYKGMKEYMEANWEKWSKSK